MEIDLSKIKKVHFIGIGGIGISAIARMMQIEGKEVSGQDLTESEIIKELRNSGISITIGQSFETIPTDAELIVYTIAIETYDPELFKKLQEQSIQIRSYPQMLGIVSKDKYTIAICGTHGKTTTTGMITHMMREAKLDPTVVIGSLLVGEKTNFIAGSSKYFIAEACEYRRSFLNLNPQLLVITNIEEDHLDYYKDLADIQAAFRELAMKVPKDGYIVCDPDEPNIQPVLSGAKAKIVDVKQFFHKRTLMLPGEHNQYDAALAGAVGKIVGLTNEVVDQILTTFPGTWRRFEFKGELLSGAKVYDDYAHHPTEIRVTLAGFRELYSKAEGYKIIVIFQPHLFSRTKAFLDDFAKELSVADSVLVLPIFQAREVDDGSISPQVLVEKINQLEGNSSAYESFESAQKALENIAFSPRDILLTMGAGEAYQIGENMLKNRDK